MAKRKRNTTPQIINKRLGTRGQGMGADYVPYLFIQDVASQGLATRIKGWKFGREHHLLSQLELNYFYLLDYSETVADIREQYPLNQEETLAIAEQLGVRHPTDPHTRQPVVMTTDFLVTIRKAIGTEERARTIKYAKDLTSARVLEKLEIERLYWKERGIDFGIVTEHEVNTVVANNIKWLHPCRDVTALAPITQKTVERAQYLLTPKVLEERLPLRDITEACDNQLGLQTGSSLLIVRHLLASRKWQTDMTRAISPSKLMLLSTISSNKKLRKAAGE